MNYVRMKTLKTVLSSLTWLFASHIVQAEVNQGDIVSEPAREVQRHFLNKDSSLISEIVHLPHSSACFTEGIFYVEENLILESCGLHGKSQLLVYVPETGKLKRKFLFYNEDKINNFFAEGVAAVGDKLYVLSYKRREILELKLPELIFVRLHPFPDFNTFKWREGWGLAYDPKRHYLYATDGVARNGIIVLDPSDLKYVANVPLVCGSKPVRYLNELEFISKLDVLAANIWGSKEIVFFSTPYKHRDTGIWSIKCLAMLNFDKVYSHDNKRGLNGIAWRASEPNTLLLSQKLASYSLKIQFQDLGETLGIINETNFLKREVGSDGSSSVMKGGIHPEDEEVIPEIVPSIRSELYLYLSSVCGYIYLSVWVVSFYPQVWLNWRRKSVGGMSLDLTAYNIVGFLSYVIYTCVEYMTQKEFNLPEVVDIQDIIFAAHSLFVCSVLGLQILSYDNENQKLGRIFKIVIILMFIAFMMNCLLALAGYIPWITKSHYTALPVGSHVLHSDIPISKNPLQRPAEKFLPPSSSSPQSFTTFSLMQKLSDTWSVVMFLGYVKVLVTVVKYNPQVYLNYVRKRTTGLSGMQFVLDMTGGIFSLLQNTVDAWNYRDWVFLYANVPKLGIGLVSLQYDAIILFQHYVLYRKQKPSKNAKIYDSLAQPHHEFAAIKEEEEQDDEFGAPKSPRSYSQ